jgi:Uma2 family endonuclease
MSVLSLPAATFALAPPLPMRRFTVDEYHRMLEKGILGEGDPIELLEGWLVFKMGRNPPHDLVLTLAEEEVGNLLPDDWFRRIQMAITTPDSEPEPDLAVVRGPRRRYGSRHPGPQDIAFLAEVADATLQSDRLVKGRIYARANIPIYWILNIPDAIVEVYTDPTGPIPSACYRSRRDYGMQDQVPVVIEGKEIGSIPVQALMPLE